MNSDEKTGAKLVFGAIFLVIIVITLFNSVYQIDAGERGVLMNWGDPEMDAVQQGLHFKIPFKQSVVKMNVQTLKIEVDADASSKDLQDVQTKIALNYKLKANAVPKLYQEIGMDYQVTVIDPAIQEAVKGVQARYTAKELISERQVVRNEIQKTLSEKLNKYYIVVEDFNIVNFQFSAEFDKAIEEKVTAEQKMLTAQMDLERIEIEAQQTLAIKRAEAEALRLQKAQITPDLIELRKVEVELRKVEVEMKALDVQLRAIEQWNGQVSLITGGNSMPIFDMNSILSQN